MKKFFDCVFLKGNHLFMLVFPCCKVVCAFAAVFSEKSPILCARVAKTSLLAFLSVFLGTSTSALGVSHNSCKKVWEVAQSL